EQAFSRNVIDLQPCAVGILEQHRIVTRRKTVLLRRVHDAGADPFQEFMRLVYIGALARSETMVMQSDRALPEALPGIFRCRSMNSEPGPPAAAIERVDRVGHDRQTHKRQQLRVESTRGGEISDCDKRMGNTVYFHQLLPASDQDIGRDSEADASGFSGDFSPIGSIMQKTA